jgi:hypothetical protein
MALKFLVFIMMTQIKIIINPFSLFIITLKTT